MNYEKNKTWNRFSDRFFEEFVKIFRYGIALILLVLVQFIIIEIAIFLNMVYSPKMEVVIYIIVRCLLLFSGVFYGCSHIACRSYVNYMKQESTGASKYRHRATENFFAGLILFVLSGSIFIILLLA